MGRVPTPNKSFEGPWKGFREKKKFGPKKYENDPKIS